MIGAAARIGLWVSSAIVASSTAGLGWATQTIEINILWLLVLTFVPTSDLITVIQAQLERFKEDNQQVKP